VFSRPETFLRGKIVISGKKARFSAKKKRVFPAEKRDCRYVAHFRFNSALGD
jgi:hypothetical protein